MGLRHTNPEVPCPKLKSLPDRVEKLLDGWPPDVALEAEVYIPVFYEKFSGDIGFKEICKENSWEIASEWVQSMARMARSLVEEDRDETNRICVNCVQSCPFRGKSWLHHE